MHRLALILPLLLAVPALAAPRIDAIAAGDPTETSAVLWARAADGDQPVTLRAEV